MIIEVLGCWNWVKGIIHLGTGNVKLQNEPRINIAKSCGFFFSIAKVLQSHVDCFFFFMKLLCSAPFTFIIRKRAARTFIKISPFVFH